MTAQSPTVGGLFAYPGVSVFVSVRQNSRCPRQGAVRHGRCSELHHQPELTAKPRSRHSLLDIPIVSFYRGAIGAVTARTNTKKYIVVIQLLIRNYWAEMYDEVTKNQVTLQLLL